MSDTLQDVAKKAELALEGFEKINSVVVELRRQVQNLEVRVSALGERHNRLAESYGEWMNIVNGERETMQAKIKQLERRSYSGGMNA